ncbi:hypothetical protein AVEN_60829-1 [Araneus ventricosus]|uniref:Uncharacterized protein n=1 Tax=Araneus ventricosus TaxID=182803 RepID=A0A4Y2TPC3_ARAVE|nr:hypothetical protein AVEN_60829-1 [Araneus ventricosus]
MADSASSIADLSYRTASPQNVRRRSFIDNHSGVKNCCASAVNNLAGLEEIIRASDLSNCNKEGECFVHVASGMGQLDVLKFLHFKGADLFRLDEVCICS